MLEFPKDFADHTQKLNPEDFTNQNDRDFVKLLDDKGFELHQGLTKDYAEQLIEMAQEPAIKEYCPNDYGSRFRDLAATADWLKKGRAVFLLIKREVDGNRLAGYGWSGAGTSSIVQHGEVTFAIRIGELGQGQGMATPFARLIIAASASIYGVRDFWLETWASNAAAVHVYHKIGFVDVAQEPADRPSVKEGRVADTRVYMSLPNEALN